MKQKNTLPKTSETTVQAVNLRRDPDNPEIMRRAGIPHKVSQAGALPFARFHPFGDGRVVTLLSDSDNSLYYRIDDGEPVKAGILPAEPILAVTDVPGIIKILVRHSSDCYLTYDDDLQPIYHGQMPELPEIQITASEFNTLHSRVPAVKLSGSSTGSAGSQLTAADNTVLRDAITGAYDGLRRQAASLGYCIQPVIARYRLLDAAGNTVALGAPVMISSSGGVTATDSITQLSSDTLHTLGEGTLSADAYRPAVIAPPKLSAPWNRLVDKLVIEATAEIDPLQRNLPLPHGIRHDAASGIVTVVSKLPGFANGTVTDLPRFRRLGIAAMEAPMRVLAEFNNPFDGGTGTPGTTVSLSVNTSTVPSADRPGKASDTIASLSRSYSAALRCGTLAILCNPRYESFSGWSPQSFIASRTSGEGGVWRLAFSVRLSTPAGNSTVRKETGGLGNAPASIGPVLSYPSADAVELTVNYLSPEGKAYRETFPLTPLPDSGIACFVSHGLEKIRFTHSPPRLICPRGKNSPLMSGKGSPRLIRPPIFGG